MFADALIIKRDSQAFLTVAWFGGRVIQAFSDTGLLVSAWKVPIGISRQDVEHNMEFHVAKGDYPVCPYDSNEKDNI